MPKSTGLARDLVKYLRYYNPTVLSMAAAKTPEEVTGKRKVWPS